MTGMKQAICVGINTYPNAPLSGCVNDAVDWAGLLRRAGYFPGIMVNEAATKSHILEALGRLVDAAKWGDRIVFQYSGHGSWVPDDNGDESDGKDEVLCAYDYEQGGFIRDDELATVFGKRRKGVRVTVISDSCHSGTVTRFAGLTGPRALALRPRFVSPLTFLPDDSAKYRRAERLYNVAGTTTPRNSTGTVLLSGCGDEEYSYDASYQGRPNGAFTYEALRAVEAYRVQYGRYPTYGTWHKMVRNALPSDQYPQSPEMYASLWQRGWVL